jgi:hypothetical protein
MIVLALVLQIVFGQQKYVQVDPSMGQDSGSCGDPSTPCKSLRGAFRSTMSGHGVGVFIASAQMLEGSDNCELLDGPATTMFLIDSTATDAGGFDCARKALFASSSLNNSYLFHNILFRDAKISVSGRKGNDQAIVFDATSFENSYVSVDKVATLAFQDVSFVSNGSMVLTGIAAFDVDLLEIANAHFEHYHQAIQVTHGEAYLSAVSVVNASTAVFVQGTVLECNNLIVTNSSIGLSLNDGTTMTTGTMRSVGSGNALYLKESNGACSATQCASVWWCACARRVTRVRARSHSGAHCPARLGVRQRTREHNSGIGVFENTKHHGWWYACARDHRVTDQCRPSTTVVLCCLALVNLHACSFCALYCDVFSLQTRTCT